MPIQLQVAALTDRGRVREVNEDAVYQKVVGASDEDAVGLFVVADGVGGRLAGEVASYWAVETIKDCMANLFTPHDPRATIRFNQDAVVDSTSHPPPPETDDIIAQWVKAAIKRANIAVRQYATQKLEKAGDTGTTVTMAVVLGNEATVANVGDSRTYLLRDGQLQQITKDHSLVQRMIDAGYAQAEEIYTHPYRNLIYRSLGGDDYVEADIFRLELSAGDFLLLCTDGLWEMVRNPTEMVRIIRESPSVETACQRLVAAANAAGGEDNIAVILVRVDG